jgi:hypothetical protein
MSTRPTTASVSHNGVVIRFSIRLLRISAESKGAPASPARVAPSGWSIEGSCWVTVDTCCCTIADSSCAYTSILAPTSPNTRSRIPRVVMRIPTTTTTLPPRDPPQAAASLLLVYPSLATYAHRSTVTRNVLLIGYRRNQLCTRFIPPQPLPLDTAERI